MANTFKRKTVSSPSISGSIIYTVPTSTTAVVIGLVIANTHATTEIEVEAYINDGSNDVDIIGVDTVIPVATALSVLDGKIVMETGDDLYVKPDLAASCDVYLSIMEIT